MRISQKEYENLISRSGNAIPASEKESKYHSNRIKVDGILFDSQKEANKYCELKLELKAGLILGFCMQPKFILLEGTDTERPETYRADFIVFNLDGTSEIIDTKGILTEVFRIKKKQFKARYPKLELKME
jgi:hypothetical protein